METYVDTGIVQLGYVHLAFLGQESLWAAEASECAAEQNSFWEFYEMLYSFPSRENRAAFTKEGLKLIAAELGLNTAQFDQCMDEGKYAAQIQEDVSLANSLSITSTPSFMVNGMLVKGALPFENFQQIIEQLLAESSVN